MRELRSSFLAATLAVISPAAAAPPAVFPVYDNMFFIGKPDTAPDGLTASNIIYDSDIWPHGQNYGVLPSRDAFAAIVAGNSANPGPVVLDIEKLPLTGDPATILQHLHVLSILADWTHAAAPGKIVGYYGYGTLTGVPLQNRHYARALARRVDAFFPPMYTYDTDRAAWAQRAKAEAVEDRSYADKPVYFYLWPQYHDNTPMQFQWIDAAYWRFQLHTSHRHADGIVLWGSSRFDWDVSSGWWRATLAFIKHLRLANPRE